MTEEKPQPKHGDPIAVNDYLRAEAFGAELLKIVNREFGSRAVGSEGFKIERGDLDIALLGFAQAIATMTFFAKHDEVDFIASAFMKNMYRSRAMLEHALTSQAIDQHEALQKKAIKPQ